jgi:HEAT repeat protein
VAAVEALAETRSPAAIAALAELENDKDRAVREAAIRAREHATKGAEE